MEAVSNDSLSRFESYDSLSSITQSTRMNVLQSQSSFTPSESQSQRPPSTCSSNNTNQSTPNEKRSRWSFTGRLFEKCKSISASSNIPNTEPQMAATSNGRNTEKIVSSSNTSGSRRSSLVDIPKALLSSFCRTSLTCSSEPKDKSSKSFQRRNLSDASINNDESTDQSSDVDGGAVGDEVEVVPTTTVITANDPYHAPPIPPKAFPYNDDDQLQVQPVKSILKRTDSSQETPNSITDDSPIPTRVGDVSPPSYSLVSDNVHPLPENLDINSLCPSDHHAQLGTHSSIPYPHSHQQLHQQHQQQEQRRLSDPFIDGSIPRVTILAETAPFKPSELDSESHTTQGADTPPEFAPGIQSNTYRDRCGERLQEVVIDPHGGDSIHADFAQTHQQRHPHDYHDPFAMSGGFSYPSKTIEDISDEKQYFDPSEADLASYQRSSISSQVTDDSVFEPSEAAVMEARRHRHTKEDVAMPMIRELDSHNEFNHNLPNGPRSSVDSKKKSIRFNDTVEIIPVHRKSEYNRRSDRNATFRVLTPNLRAFIRDELNDYKMREMAVHIRSMGNTAFH
ncbi:hypothetical protein BGX21_011283 [Mortierella sp. AD011]|nr:hypothetical protein BGX20_001367 [Mortierella sp. AD010]KAF9391279.1 hypothetical protein BGX21_011283 [Mortierella sp. AD011]